MGLAPTNRSCVEAFLIREGFMLYPKGTNTGSIIYYDRAKTHNGKSIQVSIPRRDPISAPSLNIILSDAQKSDQDWAVWVKNNPSLCGGGGIKP